MPPKDQAENKGWERVQDNPTYLRGVLTDEEGFGIRWHSPKSEASSQIFCVSAWGRLRTLLDGHQILTQVFAKALPYMPAQDRWKLVFEHADAPVLGETGGGTTPTNIDVYCSSGEAVICIESKFRYDADEGFGACGQFKGGFCSGHYGPGSDLKTQSAQVHCRLELQDGDRSPRKYWEIGREYFRPEVFGIQVQGQNCPFAKSNYQLMRNFLFAATTAGTRPYGVIAVVPEKRSARVKQQVDSFRHTVLLDSFQDRIGILTYDTLQELLLASPHEKTRTHGHFLGNRMTELL